MPTTTPADATSTTTQVGFRNVVTMDGGSVLTPISQMNTPSTSPDTATG